MPPVVKLTRVRELAETFDMEEIYFNDQSKVISFTRHLRFVDDLSLIYDKRGNPAMCRWNVYWTTGKVGTALDHPTQGKTQMFRDYWNEAELIAIMTDPRVHLGTGYQRRKNNPRANMKRPELGRYVDLVLYDNHDFVRQNFNKGETSCIATDGHEVLMVYTDGQYLATDNLDGDLQDLLWSKRSPVEAAAMSTWGRYWIKFEDDDDHYGGLNFDEQLFLDNLYEDSNRISKVVFGERGTILAKADGIWCWIGDLPGVVDNKLSKDRNSPGNWVLDLAMGPDNSYWMEAYSNRGRVWRHYSTNLSEAIKEKQALMAIGEDGTFISVYK